MCTLLEFTACTGRNSLVFEEFMPIIQRKINTTERTVGDCHVCPIPLKKCGTALLQHTQKKRTLKKCDRATV